MLIDAVVDYAIYMLDPGGIVTTWNPGAERIKGYSPSEAIGQHFERFFTPEDRRNGAPHTALETARRLGRYESEGWRQRRDGSRFWALAVIDAIYDETGKLAGFAKITRDMTERRKTQEALWESERRFRLFVNAVVDYAIYMLDTGGTITAWNTGAARIKGYSAIEAIGRHFSEFYTEEDRNLGLPAKALATAVREGRYETEGWRVRKDGTRFWAHAVLDPVRDEAGQLIGFAKITRDMTEPREAQRRLEQAREALHHAQKMEAIGQLTGGIAHDFNNILAAIVNNLELARRDVDEDSELRRHIEAALTAAYNGGGLIQQMLVFARKQPVKVQPLDVNAALGGLIEMLRRVCPENIDILTDFAPESGFASADPPQLQTALLNLVINARDAMHDGGRITIATARAPAPAASAVLAPGDYVRISVADNGPGMAPHVLTRAFEPFFTTKDIGKGTGLGLSMVHGAIHQMGGDVEIESDLGRGTTVRLWLPVAAPPEAPAAEAAQPPAAAPRKSGTELILVEDDAIVSMATAEMLQDAGYRVHEAGRGEHALQLLDLHPGARVLVTDVGLPGMNGHELALESRRRRPDIKVLFITGHDRSAEAARLTRDADTEFLGKPYQPEDLFEALRRLAPPAG